MSTYTVNCAWLPVNNFLFQIANVFLLLSYLCPPTLNGIVYLRLSLGLAGLFFALWGWLVLCAPDTALWNIFFFVGNMAHLVYILLSRRTKKFRDDMEEIYEKLFKPLSVPRYQFRILAEKAKPERRDMTPGDIFATDGETSDCLSIVLEGRMEVRKHGLLIHVIEQYQFLNSSEWVLSQEESSIFEVTIQCQTPCRILSWNRLTLLNLFKKNPYLKAVTDSIVSTDVATKIFIMNRMIGKGTGQLSRSIYSLNIVGIDDPERDQPEMCQSLVNAVEENHTEIGHLGRDQLEVPQSPVNTIKGNGDTEICHFEMDQSEVYQSPVNAVEENEDLDMINYKTRLLPVHTCTIDLHKVHSARESNL